MPILIDHLSRVLIHGTEGNVTNFAHQLLSYGTDIVAYIQAGRGGDSILDLPVCDSVKQVKKQTVVNVSLIFSPPHEAANAILEAEESEIPLIICCTSGIPLLDMVEVLRIVERNGKSLLVGPGSYGMISPGQTKIGCMPGYMYSPGNIGIISRYGTLMDEVAWGLTMRHKGQSTCVGVGEYPFLGTPVERFVSLFEKDEQTKSIVILGKQEDLTSVQKGKKPIFGLAVDAARTQEDLFPIYEDVASLLAAIEEVH